MDRNKFRNFELHRMNMNLEYHGLFPQTSTDGGKLFMTMHSAHRLDSDYDTKYHENNQKF